MENNIMLKQSHSLSPQMIQTMEILQMGTQELLEFVNEVAQENPVLEVDDIHKSQDEGQQIANKIEDTIYIIFFRSFINKSTIFLHEYIFVPLFLLYHQAVLNEYEKNSCTDIEDKIFIFNV
jgi:DNA-directed RNA polymerase specialized sigma54-like protein